METRTRILGDVAVFEIEGDFTRVTATFPTPFDLVKAQLQDGKRKILLNFAKTGFVDSFGVRQIIQIFTATKDVGGSLKVAALPRQLELTLEITKVIEVLDIWPDEESALASFAALPGPKSG